MAELAGADVERAAANGATKDQLAALEYHWTRIANHFGIDAPPNVISYDSVQRYIIARREGGARGQTIAREVQALKRACVDAHRRGWLVWSPEEFPKVRRDPPDPKRKGKLHPPAIIAEWLGALDTNARDEAEVAMFTGLRHGEIKRISAQWIEPAPAGSGVDVVLRVPAVSAKARKERVLPLVPRVFEILSRRAKTTTPGLPIMSQVSHRTAYRTAARRVGYQGRITLRDLRHTWATLATRAVGVDAARDGLGHSDLSMTNRYVSGDLARLASATLAVEAMVGTDGRHSKAKKRLKRGRAANTSTRPLGPLASLVGVANHLVECASCYEAALDRMRLHVATTQTGTGRPAQVGRKGAGS